MPIQVRIEELAGRVAEQPLRLAAPATLTLADGRHALDGLDLRLGRARLTGAFALGPREVTAQATLDPLPLDMLGPFGGAPDLTGQLTARLTLQGPADNPSGTLEARATDVSMSALTARRSAAGRADPDRERSRRGACASMLRGEGVTEQPIRLNAELPLVVDLASGVFDVPGEGQIAGSLDAEVRLALLADILALDDQRLEGPLVADLSVSGTVAQPDVNGTVRIDNALYENGTTGTVLRDLTPAPEGEPPDARDRAAHRQRRRRGSARGRRHHRDRSGGRLSGGPAPAARAGAAGGARRRHGDHERRPHAGRHRRRSDPRRPDHREPCRDPDPGPTSAPASR